MTPRPVTPMSLADQAAAVQAAENAQARAATADNKLQSAGQGTDPDYVTTEDRFQGMTYDQLYQAVHGEGGLDAAGLQGQAGVWRQASSEVLNLSTFNLVGMTRLFNEGQWQGATADAGQAATERFVGALNEVGQVFGSVAARVEALGYAAEAVRLAVQPKQVSSGPLDPDDPVQSILPGLSNPATDEQARVAEAAARDAIIQALDTTYTPVFPPSGSGVPAYVDMSAIGGEPGAAGPGAGGPNGQDGGPDSGQNSPVTEDPAANSPQQSEDEGSPSDTDQPSDDTSGGQDNSDTATDPSSTTPSGTDTIAAQTASPGTSVPSGSGPGVSSPSSGLPGSGTPVAGGPSSGAPGAVLGRGVPGVAAPTTGPGVAAASGTGSGAGTRHGMVPGMGAPGAGRGGNRDNSGEHYAPEYLRGVQPDWTEGIIAYSGVLGGEDELTPDARPPAPVVPSQELPARTVPASTPDSERRQAVSPPVSAGAVPDSTRESSSMVAAPPDRDRVSQPGHQDGPEPTSASSAVTSSAVADESCSDEQAGEQSFSFSGAGPVMDGEVAQDALATPQPAEEFFQYSGAGPVMDDNPAEALRQ